MSSAILLYGMALIYGATGTTALPEIATATANVLKSGNLLLVVGEIFIFVGLRLQGLGRAVPHVGARHLRRLADALDALLLHWLEGGWLRGAAAHLRLRRPRSVIDSSTCG